MIVTVPVEVEVERIIWKFVTSEDYYVKIGNRTIETVGFNEYNDRWMVCANQSGKRLSVVHGRGYKVRDTAVATLVRAWVADQDAARKLALIA